MNTHDRLGRISFAAGIFLLSLFVPALAEEPPSDGHDHEEPATEVASDDHDREDAATESADDGHGRMESPDMVSMSPEQADAFGIVIEAAERAPLPGELKLPAEVRFDANKLAKIVPRVSGIVRSLEVTEGDQVEIGQVLAALDSRDLAGLKADFLEAAATEKLTQATFERERRLRADGVTSEADFLQAKASLAVARAGRESAETKLHAVGVSHSALATLSNLPDGALGRYYMTSPLAGTVIARDIALGEALPAGESGGREAFVVATDDTVWVDISVYATDLSSVRAGDFATLHDKAGELVAEGRIAFVTPQLQESSRAATARMILANANGALRPGSFLTARISSERGGKGLRVPSAAVHEVEGQTVLFVPVEGGFAPQVVSVGAQSPGYVEIVSGLSPGARYVARGAFTLKADIEKAAFGGDHGH